MKLVVGLGNPGEKYEKTRHNLGYMVVDHFLQDLEPIAKTVWQDDTKLKSDIAFIEWEKKPGEKEKIILAKPKTHMNNSGMAVKLIADYYKIEPEDILILHDELDLPLGSLRIRMGGSSAGHRGIESILQSLGTEKFWRFRLGISHPRTKAEEEHKDFYKDVDEFVLGTFSREEQGRVKELIHHASGALKSACKESLLIASTKYNTH